MHNVHTPTYVSELKVHFVPSYIDKDKGFELSRAGQKYYSKLSNCKTQVLPTSLISIAEVFKSSGVNHITVSPLLLAELSTANRKLASAVSDTVGWVDQKDLSAKPTDHFAILKDESAFRIAFTRSKDGANEGKLSSVCDISSSVDLH